MTDILAIPDTQVKPGVPVDHIIATATYILEHKPKWVIHLGDHWDLPTLAPFEFNKPFKASFSKVQGDIEAGKKALHVISGSIDAHNTKRRKQKKKQYKPNLVFLVGNHEQRLVWYRKVKGNPSLTLDDLGLHEMGWYMVPYLKPVKVSGIVFSHYFVDPDLASGKAFGGHIHNQLKSLGHSFVQGHKPGLAVAGPRVTPDGRTTRGIIAGSFYDYDQDYMNPQSQAAWHGILHLRDCHKGNFRLEELPKDYLMREYL